MNASQGRNERSDGEREEEETQKTQKGMPNILLGVTFLYSGGLKNFLLGNGLPLPIS